MIHAGNHDTSSRPPIDLGGASAVYVSPANNGIRGAMMRSSRPQPEISPLPGLRGKYG